MYQLYLYMLNVYNAMVKPISTAKKNNASRREGHQHKQTTRGSTTHNNSPCSLTTVQQQPWRLEHSLHSFGGQ